MARGNITGKVNTTGLFNDSRNYNDLLNIPTINGVALIGDLTTADLGITEKIEKASYLEFPNVGSVNNIYVDTTEERTYRWDELNRKYYIIGDNSLDIICIDGGNA